MVKRICVYCGSRMGKNGLYQQGARQLGEAFARHGIGLVYGGSNVGLMMTIANAVMANGGQVVGIIPTILSKHEPEHDSITELHVVNSMHERKALMEQLSDGFIAMPGGVGTLDELFEILTWKNLKLHEKPVGLLNVAGFYEPMMWFIEHSAREGFIADNVLEAIKIDENPDQLLEKMLAQ
jgi:uncharacterized protein (TIGR00730 family)